MSIEAVTWAFAAEGLTPAGKLVLILMADKASDGGFVETKNDSLCAQANIDQERLMKVFAELKAIDFMESRQGESKRLRIPEPDPAPARYTKKPIPKSRAERVFNRDGRACLRCGEKENLTVDHVVPEWLGGSGSIENLQTLCRSCNARKGVKHIDFRDQGVRP